MLCAGLLGRESPRPQPPFWSLMCLRYANCLFAFCLPPSVLLIIINLLYPLSLSQLGKVAPVLDYLRANPRVKIHIMGLREGRAPWRHRHMVSVCAVLPPASQVVIPRCVAG